MFEVFVLQSTLNVKRKNKQTNKTKQKDTKRKNYYTRQYLS